jgi:hypothetical protein
MIDNGLGFALVPWTLVLDRYLGRHVAGVARESGGIDWCFGRDDADWPAAGERSVLGL